MILQGAMGWVLGTAVLLGLPERLPGAETFRVVTYNLENYVLTKTATRNAKSELGREQIRETLLLLQPDVLALQEVGGPDALQELQKSLSAKGLDLPYRELVRGWDTNIQLAILSRFPLIASRSHTNESFLLQGRRFRVQRGFGEVDIAVGDNYRFTLFVAHLKSKLASSAADEADLRFEEAKILREKIDRWLTDNPKGNLLLAGDLNDSKNSPSIREILGGRGRNRLIDTRPAERDVSHAAILPTRESRVTWTHFYSTEDLYSRIDYLLVNTGMAREWVPQESYILAWPRWAEASDHRPLVATFRTDDK